MCIRDSNSTCHQRIACVIFRSDASSAEMEALARATANPDEINIGDSGEESGGEGEGAVEEVPVGIEQQVIPSAVFGSIPESKHAEVLGTKEVLGAKQRFAKKT